MPILGIAPGATGIFAEVPLPPESVFPSGTAFSWSSDDPANTSLTPSSDGTQVAVAVASSIQNNATGFNLTVIAEFTDPASGNPVRLSKVAAVPFNFPPPPPPPVPTDVDITQLS